MIDARLIRANSELHDAMAKVDLGAGVMRPVRLAVIGGQSSGKSSIVAGLMGYDCTPQGTGVVTRTPIEFHLLRTATEEPYVEFQHKPEKRFPLGEAVAQEILEETKRLAGASGVSAKPIVLRFYSRDVVNMTFVDLPGIVQTSVAGQPESIVADIADIVMQYISDPSTVILAVTPANADVANSVAIQFARRVDAQLERTIGVLTKLDLVDRGVSVIDVLENRILPLKRDWIGVVNRGQADNEAKVPLVEQRRREQAFFVSHRDYAPVAARMGIGHLARVMNSALLQHLQRALPGIQKAAGAKDAQLMAELAQLPARHEPTFTALSGYVRKFELELRRQIDTPERVTFAVPRQLEAVGMDAPGVRNGSGLRELFFRDFAGVVRSMSPAAHMSDERLLAVTRNAGGIQPTFDVSGEVFMILVREHIQRMTAPCESLVTAVHEAMSRLVAFVARSCFRALPALQEAFLRGAEPLLTAHARDCMRHVRWVLRGEVDLINTHHPVLRRNVEQLPPASLVPDTARPGPAAPAGAGVRGGAAQVVGVSNVANPVATSGFEEPPKVMTLARPVTALEAAQFQRVRHCVTCCVDLVKESLIDQLPKALVTGFVRPVAESLGSDVMLAVHRPETLEALLAEDPACAERRAALREQLEAVRRVCAILDSLRAVDPALLTATPAAGPARVAEAPRRECPAAAATPAA